MHKFSERLSAIGFSSYTQYLASPHWQDFKSRYKSAGLPMRCAVCQSSPVQLHHHTYARLGAELLTDVTPLCREHHVSVHEWLKSKGLFVTSTRAAVKRLSRRLKKSFSPIPVCPVCPVPTVVLTAAMLHAGGRVKGIGWSKSQLKVFNVPWPPPKGWLKKLVGRVVAKSLYERFIELGNARVAKYGRNPLPCRFSS